ncbi:unnamed protein product [Rotaria sp. Silwood2]|nr:unnamed protein product [Rotaria sp. Silwood2]
MGKHLSDFTFMQWLLESTIKISPFNLLSTNLKSSSLSKLTNDIDDFDECLYLLDRRLECLCTLIVYISEITNSSLNINNTIRFVSIYRKRIAGKRLLNYEIGLVTIMVELCITSQWVLISFDGSGREESW